MKIENSALPESGYIEKVIDVEKLESGNYQVTARAFPTRKGKVQNYYYGIFLETDLTHY